MNITKKMTNKTKNIKTKVKVKKEGIEVPKWVCENCGDNLDKKPSISDKNEHVFECNNTICLYKHKEDKDGNPDYDKQFGVTNIMNDSKKIPVKTQEISNINILDQEKEALHEDAMSKIDWDCLVCGSLLQKRPTRNENNSDKFLWGCTNIPKCKKTYRSIDSKPSYFDDDVLESKEANNNTTSKKPVVATEQATKNMQDNLDLDNVKDAKNSDAKSKKIQPKSLETKNRKKVTKALVKVENREADKKLISTITDDIHTQNLKAISAKAASVKKRIETTELTEKLKMADGVIDELQERLDQQKKQLDTEKEKVKKQKKEMKLQSEKLTILTNQYLELQDKIDEFMEDVGGK